MRAAEARRLRRSTDSEISGRGRLSSGGAPSRTSPDDRMAAAKPPLEAEHQALGGWLTRRRETIGRGDAQEWLGGENGARAMISRAGGRFVGLEPAMPAPTPHDRCRRGERRAGRRSIRPSNSSTDNPPRIRWRRAE